MTNLPTVQSVSDIEKMAKAIAGSGLFGFKKFEEAMALMLIAQAEGTHPALAARDYNIILGKPALKADAMMARFQSNGGKVQWDEMTDTRVAATFSHPQGGSVKIDWDMKRAQAAGLGGKDMWKKFPRQMLRARVVSEGIRAVFPGVVIGVYTPEEVQDFDAAPTKPAPNGTTIEAQAVEAEKHGDTFTPDWPEGHPITKEQAAETFKEASDVLEVVSTQIDLSAWKKQYIEKLKLCSQYQWDTICKRYEEVKAGLGSREMDQQANVLMAG